MSDLKVRGIAEIAHSDRAEHVALPVARFVISVLLAAGISRLLWSLVPSQLSIKTDIVGYPIFADFNLTRYTNGYYFFALVFPILAVLIYLTLAWKGPLRRRRSPDAAMFPVAIARSTEHDPVTAVDAQDHVGGIATVWCVARVGLVALTVALEVAVSFSGNLRLGSIGSYLGALAYVGVVAAIAWVLRRWSPAGEYSSDDQPSKLVWTTTVSRANSVAALGVIPMLYVVSRGTNVAVVSTSHIVRYPWFPPWLAIALTLIAALALRHGAARANTAAEQRELEGKVLTWVVGPILLFLVLASLPGALGWFQGFDDAQFLAAPQLIFQHGLFPWRDIYVFHGLLNDVLDGGIGMVVFGNSRWGEAAGSTMLLDPLYLMAWYAFVAYFCGKNRLVLVGFSIAIATGLLQVNAPPGVPLLGGGAGPLLLGGGAGRFLLVPVFFVLLDQVLRRPSWMRCTLFMFVLFAGAILTPEATLFVPCLFGTVALFELTGRAREASLSTSFVRTWRCLVVGGALTGAWVVFLLGTRSLSAFIGYFLYFVPGHGLEGAYPITAWNLGQDLMVTFEWMLPTVLLLATIWRVASKLRTRSPWEFREWVMVAAALCSAVYFPQALDRADPQHVQLSFAITVPLLMLWVIDLLDRSDRNVSRAFRRGAGLRHMVTGVAVVAVFLGTTGYTTTVSDVLRNVPAHFHPSVVRADIPSSKLLGYTVPGFVDTQQVEALGEVLDRYAGRSSPVFDYSNDEGVVNYLLNRVPGTRFYLAAAIQTPSAQKQAISDLAVSRPPVVIFSSATFGLSGNSYDGIPQSLRSYALSVYLFAHYRPLLDVQGTLILLRDDLSSTAPPVPVGDSTADLYYDTPACNFGYIPNFLSVPSSVANQQGIHLDVRAVDSYAVIGWAIDAVTRNSAKEVFAVVNGKVVATASTGRSRPDVSVALNDSDASASGFAMIFYAPKGSLTLYALNSDGTVSQLGPSTPAAAKQIRSSAATEITTPDGVTHHVAGSATLVGRVDQVASRSAQEYRATLPVGQSFGSYSWLRVTSSQSLRKSTFILADQPTTEWNHWIVFNVLPQAATSLVVGVGSCLQWHGYSADNTIYVRQSGVNSDLRFSLIR